MRYPFNIYNPGTITRGATSLNYVHMVLLPVLTSMFHHLGRNGFGSDLLGSYLDKGSIDYYGFVRAHPTCVHRGLKGILMHFIHLADEIMAYPGIL